ncbi:MAG: hypothetical protein F9K44_05525 [Hyphomicrobiaceae bacterium]|nr:MAG: hypothetical protein F9K44_05525 [Hyphomicrobiaceae bacterium]
MQAVLLWAAAATSLVTFAVHTFVGGVYVAQPLMADQGLPKAAKWLAYYCWHIVTMLLLAMSAAFGAAATGLLTRPAALGLAVFCAACSLLSMSVALKARIAPWRFPSTTLFATTAALGLAGALA